MNVHKIGALAAVSLLCVACSTSSQRDPAPAASAPAAGTPAAQSTPRIVKSRDGRFTGEMVGTPAPNSRFAQLQIGMNMAEVQERMGRAPDRLHTYESGKRWIPFYFGNDATRMQALYKNEGCLIFTGGSVFGGGGNELIRIEADPSGACYQP